LGERFKKKIEKPVQQSLSLPGAHQPWPRNCSGALDMLAELMESGDSRFSEQPICGSLRVLWIDCSCSSRQTESTAIVLQIVDFVEDKCGMSEDEHPRVRPKPELRKLPAKNI
jgi:hypothetical protein